METNLLSKHIKICFEKLFSSQVVSDSFCDAMNWWSARLLCPWDPPGKNAGVGCRALLQGIFPTQGWNPGLLHLLLCRWIFYC